jgi:diguanylate cyclase (GGDEF)-like protein
MSTPLLSVIGLDAARFDATGATAFARPPLAASPTMSGLLRPAPALPIHATCQIALETFLADAALIALPVLNEDASPSAVIDRFPFVEFFSRRYRRELFGERGLGHFLEEHPEVFPARKPLVVQVDASLDEAARILMSAQPNQLTSALLVAQGARYQGIASSLELLNELARRKQEELFFLAHYDALTHIPNRMLFTDRLGQACREALRSGREVGLLFVDVDRFKQVNDSLGHAFGDELLCIIARRMQACARDCDTVARLGGDEFAVLMDDVHGRADTEALARRLVEAMREPVRILEREVRVSLSIGIALYPRDDRDSETLLSKADAAMYEVKTSGRNGYRHFEAGVSSFSSERSSLEAELKQAVARNEFTLCYQPQIHLASGAVVGVEALIRWKHPHRGLLSPGSFIEIAEESGLIVPISDWVLSEASRQHRDWRRQGMPPLRMGINIASLQFHQPDFVKRVKRMLAEPGIDPAMIEFELKARSCAKPPPCSICCMNSKPRASASRWMTSEPVIPA